MSDMSDKNSYLVKWKRKLSVSTWNTYTLNIYISINNKIFSFSAQQWKQKLSVLNWNTYNIINILIFIKNKIINVPCNDSNHSFHVLTNDTNAQRYVKITCWKQMSSYDKNNLKKERHKVLFKRSINNDSNHSFHVLINDTTKTYVIIWQKHFKQRMT